jgi:Zn-dependent protease
VLLSNPALIPIFFVVFLFSLSFHEAAHAWTASKFGDQTGKDLGRVTLNPLPHIDIFGTVIFPLMCMLMPGALMFGWAKPVPVNTRNMTDPKWGDIWVSAAGPLSNAFLVVCFFMLYRYLFVYPVIDPESFGSLAQPLEVLCQFGLMLNVVLMVFNFLPIPPLDGSHVLRNLLPYNAAQVYQRFEVYGGFLLMLLVFTGVTSYLITPIINMVFFLVRL